MSSYIKGIDVSEHNGIIDWEKVKASGIEFAMIRAGYGQTADRQFKRNAEECNRLGFPCGVYWFSYALNAAGAAREAAVCLDTIRPYNIDFPVAFDLEYDSVNYAQKQGVYIGMGLASDMARAFLRAIRDAGYTAMNYTNLDYLSRYFDDSIKAEFPIWLAQWPGGTPNLETPPRTCGIWQYSEKGSVSGISGPVDLDVCYETYTKEKGDDSMDQEKFNQMFDTAMQRYRKRLQDNDSGEWSEAARKYAVDNRIFEGSGAAPDGTKNYMWEDFLTREQCALVLYRFAQRYGLA